MTTTKAGEPRIERDSMGEIEVPADALYGASTQRAVLNFPISGQPFPRRFLQALALIKLAAAETNGALGLLEPDRRRGHRGGGQGGRRRRPRRPVPDRHLPDRLGDLDEHEHERGHRPPRGRATGQGRHRSPERRRQPLPELERRDPDRAPAVGRDGDRVGADPGARIPPHGARRQGAGVLARHQDRSDPPAGCDAHPARPGVPWLRRAGRGIAAAGEGGTGRAPVGAAGRHGRRDRDQRRIPSMRSGPAPASRPSPASPSARPTTTSTPRRRSTWRSRRTARSGPSR